LIFSVNIIYKDTKFMQEIKHQNEVAEKKYYKKDDKPPKNLLLTLNYLVVQKKNRNFITNLQPEL